VEDLLEELKKRVCKANQKLPELGLSVFTWGNVSGLDREKGLFVIKPSGVPYDELCPEKMIVMNLGCEKVEGALNPSSDTPTHCGLYKAFPKIGGIVHTHSRWATIWAQAGASIPVLGTTHADCFYGPIPCTREMTFAEIRGEYEKETAAVIAEAFAETDPMDIPAALVRLHGAFAWGKDCGGAVYNAAALEEVAMMAWHTVSMPQNTKSSVTQALIDRHFLRKHGKGAYYGQNHGV
jgi:L-ribulose-5-phosphate 4-epimerase